MKHNRRNDNNEHRTETARKSNNRRTGQTKLERSGVTVRERCATAAEAHTFWQRYGPVLRRAAARARAPHGQALHPGEQPPPHAAVARARPAYRQAALSTDATAPRPHPHPHYHTQCVQKNSKLLKNE